MAMPERAVAGVQLVGVDLQRVPLEDCAHQREARILVPAPRLVEIGVRGEEREAEHPCRSSPSRVAPSAPLARAARIWMKRRPTVSASAMTVAQAAPLMPQRGMNSDVQRHVGRQPDGRRQQQPAIEVRRDRARVKDPRAEDEQRSAGQNLQRRNSRRVLRAEQRQQNRAARARPLRRRGARRGRKAAASARASSRRCAIRSSMNRCDSVGVSTAARTAGAYVSPS